MPTSLTNILLHIVFSTKNREPWIQRDLQLDLYQYITGVIRHEKSLLVVAGGMPDHVHLLVRLKSDLAAASLVRSVKAHSSRWMKDRCGIGSAFQWQVGYGAFSVSESRADTVRRYIERQEEHHARWSFADEVLTLARRNRIEVDERFLLG